LVLRLPSLGILMTYMTGGVKAPQLRATSSENRSRYPTAVWCIGKFRSAADTELLITFQQISGRRFVLFVAVREAALTTAASFLCRRNEQAAPVIMAATNSCLPSPLGHRLSQGLGALGRAIFTFIGFPAREGQMSILLARREFVAGLGGAVAWPLTARAQQTEPMRRVAALFRDAKDGPGVQSALAAFRERLAMLGWVEGGDLRVDYRFANTDPDRFAAYAEELVNLRPDVIFAGGGPAARAVQQRTAVIPIVFVGGGDVASSGLVGNIARPSGNMTGFTNYFGSLGGKWLELFKEAVPGLTRVAHVVSAIADRGNPRSGIPTSLAWIRQRPNSG
jgi:hypothetical protein